MREQFHSEFMDYLNRFMVEHPDVADDRKREWGHLWDPAQPVASLDEIQPGALNDGVSVTIQ